MKDLDYLNSGNIVEKGNYLLFWDGFPSQWYASRFTVANKEYNCAEQFMMACKARFFGDTAREQLIMEANSPYLQKRLGRQVDNFNEELWAAQSRPVVFAGNLAKFTQNETLRDWLLATGDKIIVEASPYDKIWGIGMGVDDPRCTEPDKWDGLNWLGIACMEVRDFMRANPDWVYPKEDGPEIHREIAQKLGKLIQPR